MNFRKKSFLRIAASFTLMGVPLAVQGQERPAPKEPETNSRYVSEEPENSGLIVELHSASSWDNNILGNNARPWRIMCLKKARSSVFGPTSPSGGSGWTTAPTPCCTGHTAPSIKSTSAWTLTTNFTRQDT